MMPVSGYMDSNPRMSNQAAYTQHHFPGFEAFPSHLKADQSKSPMMYETWPCNGNCSRYPVPCHGCCNHGNFSGYYSFRPACPKFAPSPAFHYNPFYPSFPEPYPVYYAPPPYYPNEEPRYEYDKDPYSNYHCCGCPNHLHSQKNDRGLKIEEQGNDAEKMDRDSVVSIQPRSYPYPVVWIPPEYMKSREHGKHNDRIEVSDSDEVPRLVKPSKSTRPIEMTVQPGQGEKQPENQQNQDKMTQFPFPIFWVPYSERKQEEGENRDQRRMITASDHSEKAPVNVEPCVSDAKTGKPQSEKEISQNKNSAETSGTSGRKKCVPIVVKEAKSEGTENKGRDVSVKRAEDTTKNAVGTIEKRKSLSPMKTSKLPPVCLRVDPLPKKRNGNGSLRSPSPPKGESEDTSTKASTALKEDSAVNTQNISGNLDNVQPKERDRKDILVIKERSEVNKAGEVNTQNISGALDNEELGEKKRKDFPVIKEGSKENKAGETTDASQVQVSVNSTDEQKTNSGKVVGAEKEAASGEAAIPVEPAQCKEVKTMSGDEAAKLIQSAFRGFEVRKWEPLKKMKQIAYVRKQVDDVKNRIQSLESSSDSDKDDKMRLLLGEKIMSLLLRLDTIQGFDSSVRDARKSLVKELVILQERLDSLTSKWAGEKAKDFGKAESAECLSGRAPENVSMEKESENASAALEENENIKETEQKCLAHIVDGMDDETTNATDKNTSEATIDIECHTAVPRIGDEDVLSNLEHMSHVSSVPEQKINVTGFSEDDKLRSLTNADNVDVDCQPEKEIGEKESDLPVDPSLPDEEEKLRCTEEVQEIDLLKQLPVGVIDEEPVISQVDYHLPEAELNRSVTDKKDEEPAISQTEEDLPVAESNNGEKVEKENEFANNPVLEVEMNQNEVNDDNKSEMLFKPEEVHSTASREHNDKQLQHEDDSCVVPADQTVSSESEAGSEAIEEKQVLFEEKKGAEQPVGSTTEEKDDAPSESNAEQEFGKIGDDSKLIEENNKLREMMEKFMEAGEDQLSVISNLTERVKELEQKLAMAKTKKKSSKPGKRKLRYAPSYYKLVKARSRVAEAAM